VQLAPSRAGSEWRLVEPVIMTMLQHAGTDAAAAGKRMTLQKVCQEASDRTW
jgi:hypothetical protein